MRSKLLQKIKVGYGLDQEGQVLDRQQTNIEDSQEPSTTHHETPNNPANADLDVDAIKEFPSLKRPSNRMPSRLPR
jgi:hypothetical protein